MHHDKLHPVCSRLNIDDQWLACEFVRFKKHVTIDIGEPGLQERRDGGAGRQRRGNGRRLIEQSELLSAPRVTQDAAVKRATSAGEMSADEEIQLLLPTRRFLKGKDVRIDCAD